MITYYQGWILSPHCSSCVCSIQTSLKYLIVYFLFTVPADTAEIYIHIKTIHIHFITFDDFLNNLKGWVACFCVESNGH